MSSKVSTEARKKRNAEYQKAYRERKARALEQGRKKAAQRLNESQKPEPKDAEIIDEVKEIPRRGRSANQVVPPPFKNNLALEENDSDCEIVDVPDLIDVTKLNELIGNDEQKENNLMDIIDLVDDGKFEEECNKMHQLNSEIDAEVQNEVKSLTSQNRQKVTKKLRADIPTDIRIFNDLAAICTFCEDSDDNVELLEKHLTNRHQQTKEGELVCPFCDYSSSKVKILMNHANRVHKLQRRKKECESANCKFSSFRGDLFNRHLNNQHKDNLFVCKHCNFKSPNHTIFLAHVKEHGPLSDVNDANTGKLFQCTDCSFETSFVAVFDKHLKDHEPGEELNEIKESDGYAKYKCPKCEYHSNLKECVETHLLVEHPTEETRFCNSACRQDELDEHCSLQHI